MSPQLHHTTHASMEPSSVEDGNQNMMTMRGENTPASMEPSSVEDGNHNKKPEAAGPRRLQWSRPQLRTETKVGSGHLLPFGTLQWSRPQLRTETANSSFSSGFNSALQWSRPQLRTETSSR